MLPRKQHQPSLQPQGPATGPHGVARVPTTAPGDKQPSPPQLQPCAEWSRGDLSWAVEVFLLPDEKKTPQEGTCLYHWCNDMGSRLASKGPTTQGQVNCWGHFCLITASPTSPGPTGRAGHGGTVGCFPPFEGCVAWRRLLASLCCIVLFRKTQISLN